MNTNPSLHLLAAALAITVGLQSCAVAGLPSIGPDYVRPSLDLPTAFGVADTPGAASLGKWTTASPADDRVRGEWWHVFDDPALASLEQRALAANQDLRAAAARVEQARAAAGLARSAYWPEIAVSSEVSRDRTSATTDNPLPRRSETTYQLPAVASWELDVFGRVRRLNESARDEAAAAGASFEAVRLALTAEVAATYFSLGGATTEYGLVAEAVRLRRRTVEVIAARVRAGTAADVDAARAETELAVTEAEAAAIARQREDLRHALSVLVGEAPVGAESKAVRLPEAVPVVPAGVPADVLERRPDVAAAERSLAAANARIGVAKAAFFPAISLTGSAGYASGDIDRLFTADSRIWSIGPQLYLPIFQGGRNRANLRRSRGAYDEAVAVFRQRVLLALREVQDALTASRLFADEAAAQQRAVAAAERAVALAHRRYDAGYVGYLDVVDAERTALGTQRSAAQLQAQRLNTAVALIKALGGGWSVRPDRFAAR